MSAVSEIKSNTSGVVTCKVKINGQDLTSSIDLSSLSIQRDVHKIPTANLILNDGDTANQVFAGSESDWSTPGNEIEVLLGYNATDKVVFSGIITGQSVSATNNKWATKLECKEACFKMTTNRKSKIFEEQTETEIWEEICNQNGISANIDENFTTKQSAIAQHETSDWDFLMIRTQIHGKLCVVKGTELYVFSPDTNQNTVNQVAFGKNVIDFNLDMNSRNQFEKVEAKGWNSNDFNVEIEEGEANQYTYPGDLSSDKLAKSISNKNYSQTNGGDFNTETLKTWASAKKMFQSFAKVKGKVKVQGHEAYEPGKLIELSGFSNRLNGKALISGVIHEFQNGNWTSQLEIGLKPEWFVENFPVSNLPASGLNTAINGLQIGVIEAIEGHPNNEYKVKVNLPLYSKKGKGVWARPLMQYMGKKGRWQWLPEVGTEVIVGFLNQDPSSAIVLGTVFSNEFAPTEKFTDKNHIKTICSDSRIEILFDDEKKTFTITTPSEKTFVLNDEKDTITLADKHKNSIVMGKKGITIQSDKDITLKAKSKLVFDSKNFEVKTKSLKMNSTNAELKGNSAVQIKGSRIDLN